MAGSEWLVGLGMPHTKVTPGLVSVSDTVNTGLVTEAVTSDTTETRGSTDLTPGRENRGWDLMPVRTPERLGVGMPGMVEMVVLTVVVTTLVPAAICNNPMFCSLVTVTLAGIVLGYESTRDLFTGGSPCTATRPNSGFRRSPILGLVLDTCRSRG